VAEQTGQAQTLAQCCKPPKPAVRVPSSLCRTRTDTAVSVLVPSSRRVGMGAMPQRLTEGSVVKARNSCRRSQRSARLRRDR